MNNLLNKMGLSRMIVIVAIICLSALLAISLISIFQTSRLSSLLDRVNKSSDDAQMMLQRKIDHLNWVMQLRDSIDSHNLFEGEKDPTKCGLGKWMYSENIVNLDDAVIRKNLNNLEPIHNQLHNYAYTINSLLEEGKENEAKTYYHANVEPALESIMIEINNLQTEFIIDKDDINQQYTDLVNRTQVIIISVSGAVVVISILVFIILIYYLTKRTNDIGRAVNEIADSIFEHSEHIAGNSRELAARSQEQSASIEELSASMNEILDRTNSNVETITAASIKATKANENIIKRNEDINKMAIIMKDLNRSNTNMSGIIKDIEDIAFKTNILALNAAVEAAHAGDRGEGFSVVASEVKTLANRSQDSAARTAGLLDNNKNVIDNTSENILDMTNYLTNITNEIVNIVGNLDKIRKDSEAQQSEVKVIHLVIEQLAQVVSMISANAEEGASSTEEMHNQANELKKIITDLKKFLSGKE